MGKKIFGLLNLLVKLKRFLNQLFLKQIVLSRGRGIRCFNTISQILDYIISKKIPYVCQKYMENPLIIHQKKVND